MISDAAARALRQYVEQLEQLEADKAAIADDIKEKLAEMRGAGYCVKTVKKVIKLRKMTEDERSEQEMLLDAYAHAVGLGGTPLGEYADAKDAERRLQ